MYTSTVVADMIGDFRHPNKEISDLVNFNLENMEISKVQLIKFILSALWAGFSIQEKVYGVKRFKGRSRVLITDTVQLPPSSIIFRVDTSGKLKDDGIVQYYYNNLWTGYANMLSFNSYNQGGNVSTPNPYAKKGDLDTPLRSIWAQPIGTVILPKRKCIHHTFAGLDGFTSPYGRSILRSTYSYWVQKQAMLQISLIAANYKASPIPVAFVDPTVQVRDASGNVISLAKDVSNAISNFKGNGFLVLNAQKDTMVSIDTIDNTAEIDKYVELLNYYDQQILRSILTPSSLFAVEEGGSYAIGLSHASAHGRIIKMIAEDVANTLLRQYTRDIIDMNFGTEIVNGHFDFLETTIDDKLKYGKMLEFSINKNILNMGDLNDLNTCRYMFGYEPVDKVFVSPASEMGMGQAEQSEERDGAEEKDALKPSKKKTTGISSKATKRATDTPYSENKE